MINCIIIEDIPAIREDLAKFVRQRFENEVRVLDVCQNFKEGKDAIEKNISQLQLLITDIDLQSGTRKTGIDLVQLFNPRRFKTIFYSSYRDTYELETLGMEQIMFVDKKSGKDKYDVLEWGISRFINEINTKGHLFPGNKVYVALKQEDSLIPYERDEILFVCSDTYFLRELISANQVKDSYLPYRRAGKAIDEMYWIFSSGDKTGRSIKYPSLKDFVEKYELTPIDKSCAMKMGKEREIKFDGSGDGFRAFFRFDNDILIKADLPSSREIRKELRKNAD